MSKRLVLVAVLLSAGCGQNSKSDVLVDSSAGGGNKDDSCHENLAITLANTSPFTVHCVSAQLSRDGKLLFSLSHHEFSKKRVLLGGKSFSMLWSAEERPEIGKKYTFLGEELSMGGAGLEPDSILNRPGMRVQSDHYNRSTYVVFHQVPEKVGDQLEIEFLLPIVDIKTEKNEGTISGRIALSAEKYFMDR